MSSSGSYQYFRSILKCPRIPRNNMGFNNHNLSHKTLTHRALIGGISSEVRGPFFDSTLFWQRCLLLHNSLCLCFFREHKSLIRGHYMTQCTMRKKTHIFFNLQGEPLMEKCIFYYGSQFFKKNFNQGSPTWSRFAFKSHVINKKLFLAINPK